MIFDYRYSCIVRFAAVLSGMFVPLVASAQGFSACGSLENAYGPFDYRVDKKELAVVERFHFNAAVESLSAGVSGKIGGDLDYTLRAFPNHHRALMAMSRLAVRDKTTKPFGMNFSVECWFERAERFRPDDAMVKVLHGHYLIKVGRARDALEKLDVVRASGARDGNVIYNLGLAYLDLNQYEKALENAHIAYAQGYPLPGLKNRLVRAGKWRDPDPK